jgi:predicted nuclease of predicted toxin-antitoxin system
MNLLADEGVDKQIVVRLREEGYSVSYVAEMAPGISDDIVLELANKEGSLLLTADKDFGDLVFRLRRLSAGVVLIRLAGLTPAKKAAIVTSVISKHAQELAKAFTVITPRGVRIRSSEK